VPHCDIEKIVTKYIGNESKQWTNFHKLMKDFIFYTKENNEAIFINWDEAIFKLMFTLKMSESNTTVVESSACTWSDNRSSKIPSCHNYIHDR